MNLRIPAVLLPCLFLPGCATPGPREGGLPIIDVQFGFEHHFVELTAGHGYIIHWDHYGPPRFYLFDRAARTRSRFEDWETFLGRIRSLPDGIEIDAVSRCSVPFEYQMPDFLREAFQQTLDDKHIRRVPYEDPRHATFCYCETAGVWVLWDGGADQVSGRMSS